MADEIRVVFRPRGDVLFKPVAVESRGRSVTPDEIVVEPVGASVEEDVLYRITVGGEPAADSVGVDCTTQDGVPLDRPVAGITDPSGGPES